MSRSKQGSKPPGYEYWSKRPNSGCGPGKKDKQMTHQIERARAKGECQNAVLKDKLEKESYDE